MPRTFRRALFAAAALTTLPFCAQAAEGEDAAQVEEVVVTASRGGAPLRADTLGASASVITPSDLDHRQVRIVSDVLRDVPGVSVGRTGAVGNLTQIRMRGAEANHTMTLIDGIEANDPFQGEFNYAALTADDAVRIEVLRGQQSALYGSEAIGGVIQYITVSGHEAPGVRLRSEVGAFQTAQSAARVAGEAGGLDYVLTGSYLTTGGFPTATNGGRDVGARLGSGAVKLGWAPLDTLRFTAVGRYASTIADENDESYWPVFEVVDAPGKRTQAKAWYGLMSGQWDLLDGHWSNRLVLQGYAGRRDTYVYSSRQAGDEGSRRKASLESTYSFGNRVEQRITAALDLERETFQNTAPPSFFPPDTTRRHIDNVGVVLDYEATVEDRLGFGAAWRHDDNDLFSDADTYRVQASWRLNPNLRLRGSAGTGIKNPEQTELFGFNAGLFPFVGNPSLKPERSSGWEGGFELTVLDGRVKTGVTYFSSVLRDEIYTDYAASPNTARNRAAKSHQKGVEIEARAKLSDTLSAHLAYAWLDADEDGVREIRRAPHSGSASLDWRDAQGRGGVNLTARYTGRTRDMDFASFSPVQLKSFVLVNLSGDYSLSDNVQAFARIENLLDEEHQEVFGYRTAPRAAYAGLKLRF